MATLAGLLPGAGLRTWDMSSPSSSIPAGKATPAIEATVGNQSPGLAHTELQTLKNKYESKTNKTPQGLVADAKEYRSLSRGREYKRVQEGVF